MSDLFLLSRAQMRRIEPYFPLSHDPTLLLGASLFGIGWGLGGYCPGPALAGLGFGSLETLVFVAAMLLGMFTARQSGGYLGGLKWKTKSAT